MARNLMPKSGIMMPYVVVSRDAAVVGVSTVDGKAGAIDLTTTYRKITDSYAKTETYTKTEVDNLITPIMTGALFKADPFVNNNVPFRSGGANGVTSINLIKASTDNSIHIGDSAAGVQGVHIYSEGRVDVIYKNDAGIETVSPLYSKRYRPEVADMPFAAVGNYVLDSQGRTIGVNRTGINSDIKQLTQVVDFTQSPTVPDAATGKQAVNFQQLSTLVANGLNTRKASYYKKQLADQVVINIDCEGDSTMFGATSNNTGVQDPNNAPATLRTTLNNLYGVTPVVNNNGVSGATMADMINGTGGYTQPYATRIATSSANIIYCNHGINDSQLNLAIDGYQTNLITFISLCRKYNKVPILVTPNINPTNITLITEAKSKRLGAYVDVMRKVAKIYDVDLVDNYYYYQKTTRMVSPITLVPDGAHPSSEGYKMSGRNMAIPLVSAYTLYKAWDKAGFANTTYFDNITSTRQYQTYGDPFNRFQGNLSGNATATSSGINMAVILDNPTDDTVLAMYGLQWTSGGKAVLASNGVTSDTTYSGSMTFYSAAPTPLNWDACFIPQKCQMYAGLQVPGILTNTTITGGGINGIAVSGYGLVPRSTAMPMIFSSTSLRNFPVVANSCIVDFPVYAFGNGRILDLRDCASNNYHVYIDYAGNGGALTFTTPAGTTTLAANVSTGVYPGKLTFNGDGTISVSISAINTTIPAPTGGAYPNLYPQGSGFTVGITYPG